MMFSLRTHLCIIRPQWVKHYPSINMYATALTKETFSNQSYGEIKYYPSTDYISTPSIIYQSLIVWLCQTLSNNQCLYPFDWKLISTKRMILELFRNHSLKHPIPRLTRKPQTNFIGTFMANKTEFIYLISTAQQIEVNGVAFVYK